MGDAALVAEFWRVCVARLERATELWLVREGGDEAAAVELKRLLHTMKGEAHMLSLMEVGDVAEAMEDLLEVLGAGVVDVDVGNAMLGAFELLVNACAECAEPESAECAATRETLAAATAGLAEAAPAVAVAPEGEARSADEAGGEAPEREVLSVASVQPAVSELRRLLGERALLAASLREAQRMLRALLAELDPSRPSEEIVERLVKTLGYGWEIDRRVTRVRSEWSAADLDLELLVDRLDEEVQAASRVPLSGMRPRMLRLARATAARLDKEVELSFDGDAYISAPAAAALEAILVHLVRNAVDHGVESPAERVAAGKPPAGHLSVEVRAEPGWVEIALGDDGPGIDVEGLRQRVEGGEALDRDAILAAIFRHGVTVREEVSETSGRGVGLDVVADEVGRIGGSVEVESELGRGTRFKLRLPTGQRADVIVPVRAGPYRCGLPSMAVVAVARAVELETGTDGRYARIAVQGAERLVRVVPLLDIFGGASTTPVEEQVIVVVQRRREFLGLLVDEYDTPRTMALRPASELPFSSPFVSAAAPSPDGRVVLVLEPAELRPPTEIASRERGAGAVPFVVVAEDAPVARELLSGLLRSFGLRVADAPDGRKALEIMERERPDLLITDIEMPFLSGLELMAEIRARPALSSVPVIVLTTRSDEVTRNRARELGAEGFLSKKRFVEEELRQVIDRCLERA